MQSNWASGQLAESEITVLIPAFNAERYVAEAIESILAQTLDNSELLPADDGTKDTTPAIIEPLHNGPPVRIVRHAHNQCRKATRNAELAAWHEFGQTNLVLFVCRLIIPR